MFWLEELGAGTQWWETDEVLEGAEKDKKYTVSIDGDCDAPGWTAYEDE